jgi:type II secretory pathway pseudopilin PulG
MLKIKKGAMFGLDARIALAIFGALSVISGAALYSAIQDSKVTALITENKEVVKAFEQYYLDTGSIPKGVDQETTYLEKLVTNTDNIAGWNGPYWSEVKGAPLYLKSSTDHVIGINFGKDTTWGDATGRTDCTVMSAGEACYFWTATQWFPVSFCEAVDAKIDGTVDADEGSVRLWTPTSNPGECTIYIKAMPTSTME